MISKSAWLSKSLQMLSGVNELIGVNYWVNKGGSTALWRSKRYTKARGKCSEQYYSSINHL